MIYAAVFLITLSSLSFEVLLARAFSITQWNHLSFMVVSLALFGFAASGTVLSLSEARGADWQHRLSSPAGLLLMTAAYSATALTAAVTLVRLPLDYFLLPLEPIQGVYLLAAYLVLSIPFGCAGAVLSAAYSRHPDKSGWIYTAAMFGSACGAFLPFPLLTLMDEGRLMVAVAMAPLVLLPVGAAVLPSRTREASRHRLSALAALLVLLATAATVIAFDLTALRPSDYKGLSQMVRFPDTRVDWTGTDIRGRIDRVAGPYVRFAPGLSLTYRGDLPHQTALFRDADAQTVLTDLNRPDGSRFARFSLPFAGYRLRDQTEDVLVVQNGGGLALACAAAAGASRITVLAPHPYVAALMRQHYGRHVLQRSPRAFLAETAQRFDVIHVEAWGPSIPGAGALDQSFILTTQAMAGYLTHLTDSGTLMVSRRLRLPPADVVRTFATARQALADSGVPRPETHLAVLRNWDTFLLIASPAPIDDPGRLSRFARDHNFDVVYLPGMAAEDANRYNIFDQPYHYEALQELVRAYADGTEARYFARQLLDTRPQSDDRPFPNRFLKWHRMASLYATTGSRVYSLLLSGEVVVAVVLLEASVVAALLMGAPLVFFSRRKESVSVAGTVYFLGLGAGFMLVEMHLIYRLMVLFGDPVVSFTVVLAGILVFSGVGGMASRRLGSRATVGSLVGVAGLLTLAAVLGDTIVSGLLGLPGGLRAAGAVGVLLVLGTAMGLPFPLGMQYLLQTPLHRAYAWAANGCTSVIAAIAAAQLAIGWGLNSILVAGIAAYLVALAAAVWIARRGQSASGMAQDRRLETEDRM